MYNSPIAGFLFHYGSFKRENSAKPYSHTHDNTIKTRFNLMKRLIKASIARPDGGDIQFPSTADLADSPVVPTALFQGDVPSTVKAELYGDGGSYIELFRVLVFARFILRRVGVTLVVAKSEEYAFDMFEALNSTGEPLTAIETFKPRVIQAEGHGQYEESDSFVWMEEIADYLNRFRTAPRRQSATARLLTAFALAEDGSKLSKRLNDQRRYLMKRYDADASGIAEKRAFLRHLAMTARVLDMAWEPHSKGAAPKLRSVTLGSDGELCISVLRAAKHNVVLGPLTRFYTLFRAGN